MNEKMKLRRRLYELDFAIYELTLFLDSHPESEKALELMREYRENAPPLRTNTVKSSAI